tara:strand:- start:1413 stop:2258 length:846 start_codon:yes stop_codon:yes gene_type:complete
MSNKFEGIYQARDIYKDVNDLYEGKTHKQYNIGYSNLNPLFKIVKPMFVVITGTPNSGKSSFTYDIAMNLAKQHKFKFVIFSPEHSLAINLKRLIEKYVKKPFDIFFENRLSRQEMVDALKFIQEHFFFIDKRSESPDISWILEKSQICINEFSIDSLIIDPFNEINPSRQSFSETEHISVLISDIKRFNRENNTFTFMIAHPNKQIRDAQSGMFEVKSLYEISGSSHFNNKADVGMIVTRDYEKEETKIRIAKVRELDLMGNIGECKVKWNNDTRCFDEI